MTGRFTLNLLKALANKPRTSVILSLTTRAQSVEDLSSLLAMDRSQVSAHLYYLRRMRLVDCRVIDGQVYYFLATDVVEDDLLEIVHVLSQIIGSNKAPLHFHDRT